MQEKRVVAPQRIHDVLVGIEHPGAAQCEVSLLESREHVALAQPHEASAALQRIDRKALDQLDAVAAVAREFGEDHGLHLVLLHLDRQTEAVADADAVGRDPCADRGGAHCGRGTCCGTRCGEQRREPDKAFHRRLKSFMSSTT